MDNNQQARKVTCPVCSAQCESLVQYCEQCGWHFELFLSRPDQEQQAAYQKRLERHSDLWLIANHNNKPKQTTRNIPTSDKRTNKSADLVVQTNHATNEAQLSKQFVDDEQSKQTSNHIGMIIYVLFFGGCIYAMTPLGLGTPYSEKQYSLGFDYKHGLGVKKDIIKANAFFKKACDNGELRGCTQLGLSYDYGSGIKFDIVKANSLYKKACDGGELIGCNNLGISYKHGLGVKKDTIKAKNLFKKACDGGVLKSCTNLLN